MLGASQHLVLSGLLYTLSSIFQSAVGAAFGCGFSNWREFARNFIYYYTCITNALILFGIIVKVFPHNACLLGDQKS